MKDRLARYGFTRLFQLESDLTVQDKLTTWMEYLGYEYWFYYQHASYVKRFQRRHDEAWKKLVDSGLLRPGDTYAMVCDIGTAFEDASEEERAKKAVKFATTACPTAEEAFTKSRRSKAFRQAQSAPKTASMAYVSIKRRSDAITNFIQQTKEYRNAQKDAERRKFLLRWIQQQIPLIESESKSPESDGIDTGCTANGERLETTTMKDVDEGQ